jgi:hypothetical protein
MAALLIAASTAVEIIRYLAHHDYLYGLVPLFSLDGEQNIPSLFSTVLLLIASLLLAIIAMLEKGHLSPDTSRWVVLAVGFLLMAIDESVSIHEMLIPPMRRLLGGHDLGIFYFAWVVPAMLLVGVLAIYFLPFVFRLPPRTAVVFVVAAAIYLGGAIGVELIEGKFRESHGVNLTFHLMVSLEEGMEMLGALVFIHALLDYIRKHHASLQIAFGGKKQAAPAGMELDPVLPQSQPQA